MLCVACTCACAAGLSLVLTLARCARAQAESEFTATVRDMLLGGAEEGHDVDAVALEISCYRHAENRTFSDVAAVRPRLRGTRDWRCALT